jgi:predicted dehydrogenase
VAEIDRRQFLQTTAGGMAAASAMAHPAPQTSGKVNVAVLGTRHSHIIGKLRVLRESPDYNVAGYCEPDGKPVTNEAFQGLRSMSEQELLSDRSIQLVIVEGNEHEMLPQGRKVIAAGKHAHLERLIAPVMEPFREMIEEARAGKLNVQMGYPWRFHPGMTLAIDTARRGYLGDLYMMQADVSTDIPQGSRNRLSQYRGGIFYDLGCYMMERILDVFGRPREVKSFLRHDMNRPDRLDDNNMIVLEFERALGVVYCAANMGGSRENRFLQVTGVDGWARVQPVERGEQITVFLREARGPYKAGLQSVPVTPAARFVGEFADMARAIRTGTPTQHNWDFELLVQETLMRAIG